MYVDATICDDATPCQRADLEPGLCIQIQTQPQLHLLPPSDSAPLCSALLCSVRGVRENKNQTGDVNVAGINSELLPLTATLPSLIETETN
jgi:hypothetical protein